MLGVLISGIYGALASVSGKVSFSPSTPIMIHINSICAELLDPLSLGIYCIHFNYMVRIASFVFMFYANAMALSKFLNALETRSSLTVTVITSATNFLTTGLLSGLILGERVGKMWFVGASIIAAGVFLIALSQGGGGTKWLKTERINR